MLHAVFSRPVQASFGGRVEPFLTLVLFRFKSVGDEFF